MPAPLKPKPHPELEADPLATFGLADLNPNPQLFFLGGKAGGCALSLADSFVSEDTAADVRV